MYNDILAKCLGNKIGDFDHKKVEKFIKDKMDVVDVIYRGLTIEELLSFNIVVGKSIKFNRTTSFSSEKFIAEEFCRERYKTNVLFKIENANAFDYSKYMTKVIQAAIEECESSEIEDYDNLDKLYDNLGMVDYEKEFFIDISKKYTIKSIEKLKDIHLVVLA